MAFAIVVTGRRRYAVKLDQLAEFGFQRNLTVISECPTCIMECMNLRGGMVALVDLNRLLDGEDVPQENQMVVLALDGWKIALWIRCVERTVQECPVAIILLHDSAATHPMSLCMLKEAQELTAILDVETLVDALRTS